MGVQGIKFGSTTADRVSTLPTIPLLLALSPSEECLHVSCSRKMDCEAQEVLERKEEGVWTHWFPGQWDM